VCVNSDQPVRHRGAADQALRLMQAINTRSTFVISRACVLHLRLSDNPHILTLSPPISIEPRRLGPHITTRSPSPA
jgi:citronellol/citronellal dehydrogenase